MGEDDLTSQLNYIRTNIALLTQKSDMIEKTMESLVNAMDVQNSLSRELSVIKERISNNNKDIHESFVAINKRIEDKKNTYSDKCSALENDVGWMWKLAIGTLLATSGSLLVMILTIYNHTAGLQ